jgi:hypothetical protein
MPTLLARHPQALHKLSEEWSFCVGDGAGEGFPLVLVSPGFERLTMRPRSAVLGKKCGEVLGSSGMNPAWLIDRVRKQVHSVASGQAEFADFLVMNRRGDKSCFPNYVRITLLNTLTGFPDPMTERMMLALQVDVSDRVQQFQVAALYSETVLSLRSQLPWPQELRSCETTLQLAQVVLRSANAVRPPAGPLSEPGPTWPSPRNGADNSSATASWDGTHPSLQDSSMCTSNQSDSSDDARVAYAITFRHTTGNFHQELLNARALERCVGQRAIRHGPLVFAEDEGIYRKLCSLAKDFHPRHVLVEAKLLEAVSMCAQNIKGNRGRKVNEKCRQALYI